MPTFAFEVTADEARRIRARARNLNVTLSEYIRQRSLPTARKVARVQRVRCEHTGAMIFSASPEMAPLTTEAVVAMVEDFP
jgi:hypothetical protein